MQRKLLPRTSSQSIVQKMLGVRTWLRSSTTVASQRRWLSGRKDVACELAASSIRFGAGVTAEIGMDLKELKARNVVVFTDPHLRDLPVVHTVLDSLADNGIRAHVFDQVRVEPNDISFQRAIAYMNKLAVSVDAIVAVGGGSVIDTAKIANLYSMFPPDDFYDYVNPPVGKGIPVPGALRPLFAIPTTAGTGSETTGVAIFDDTRTKSKTGVAHRRLKPTLGIVDPLNTATLPPNVAKYSGFDVLCHAIESFTALPFTERPYPASPNHRPAYQGSNPISDIWSLHALHQTNKFLRRAVNDVSDVEARSAMLLASTAAGIGFGNAGVHLCHGMSYPIASQVSSDNGAVFKLTGVWDCTARVGIGLLGYTSSDIPALVKGTLPQHRVTKLSPRPAAEDDLHRLFADALQY
ncbi:hypothetical protein DYB31_011257 [Aphanomyces astaci]|uniref:hydroxyacid-oxoacid transhydrogenase n=1 Tax=Aphanomyces astaci TaxID=112090 RepID=A0A397EIA1_APHAT|nr:hypothetical protein DYB31_011257 [Aphanomyces astaci]